ncbi:MAG: carboxypeptidase M32 [Rhabdochlamydiaceae bacterium]|jgi:carboxypeptidase Taq
MAIKSKKSAFSLLQAFCTDIALMSSTQALLDWDQETYMPPGAIEFRGMQTALLSGQIHKLKVGAKFKGLLSQLIDLESGKILDDTLTPTQIVAVKEWKRTYLQEIKLPSAFVKTFATVCSKASHTWAEARKSNKFSLFAPHLQKIVSLCQKKARFLGSYAHPYDALLDLHEPGMTVAELTPLFERLKTALTTLLKTLASKPKVNTSFLEHNYPQHKQMEFGRLLLEAMGFDPATSRLDLTSHPFCSGLSIKDTRMTTRIHPNLIMSNIFSVLHEGGHGLYNKGLPEHEFGTPLCEHSSLGIDESQSRWWETRIGRSLPFWKYFYPKLQSAFPEQLSSLSIEDFVRGINIAEPSFIRVEADEVTYCLHIILRFEIEKALMEGSLKVKDIPKVWNEKMQAYFGIVPKTDAEGCLQDIHWSLGSIGYFPTYALGNIYAAQFFTAFEKAHPDWQEKLSQGNLSFIREWLYENIHRHGKLYTPHELTQRIVHQPLSEKPYIAYLEGKYLCPIK